MGKKRRLKSAKAKFKSKHSNHPRMRLLAEETVEENIVEPAEEPEVAVTPIKVVPEPPKVKKKTTPRKKRAPSSRKRSTKKKTTSASV